jgi:hypothetical protein
MKSFLSRFGALISLVLSGFDRLRLVGDSRLLNNDRGVQSYLYQRGIQYVDFPAHAEQLTQQLRRETERRANDQGVPLRHLNRADVDKEALALELAEVQQRRTGPIAVLTSVESCLTYRLRKNALGCVYPVKERGKCLHYYHYFRHADLGLCYVRVQSWFPFTVRVGLNGRQWLFRQLENRGVAFQKCNNLLVSVADPELAQRILDEQPKADWPTVLTNLVQPVQPLWSYLHDSARTPYYWMTEQSEWATDFIFHSAADLAKWYPRWLRHGLETLQCKDVLRFLGKKVPQRGYGSCTGEVKIDFRERSEGTRLKFWYDTNSLKMYDKLTTPDGEGLPPLAHRRPESADGPRGFRLETTINQAGMFKVFRRPEGADDDTPPSWQTMRKGVADMPRRAEVGQASNNHLAESLATVADTHTLGELLHSLGEPVFVEGKRQARALNPLTGKDGRLLRALADGKFLVNGFRNRDVRVALYGEATTAAERRRQAAALTRQLALLRAHGVINKVPKTHRYQLSAAGRRIVAALLAAHASNVTQLSASA